MINATSTSTKTRELIPAGNYVARCYSMIHIGTVTEEIMGEPKRLNKVRITWELPTEMRTYDNERGEQPMVISKEYTLSMHEKANLRRDLESWRGKAFTDTAAESFDITKLLGIPCMLNIVHRQTKTGNEYATISNVSALPKGFNCPTQINQSFEWNYMDRFDERALSTFPDFIKEKIMQSEEYKAMKEPIINVVNEEPAQEEEHDDLPF